MANHLAAIGIELMNEPPIIESSGLYQMYQQCYTKVRGVAPDLALGLADSGSDAVYTGNERLPASTRAWLRSNTTTHLFYAFHCYGCKLDTSVANAVKLSQLGGAAVFLTEFGGSTASGGG